MWWYREQVAEYFWELAEHDGNMEQTPKSKKFEASPAPHHSKRASTKKMTGLIGQSTLYAMHSTLNILMFFIVGEKTNSSPTYHPWCFQCAFSTPLLLLVILSFFVSILVFFFFCHFLLSSVLFGCVFVVDYEHGRPGQVCGMLPVSEDNMPFMICLSSNELSGPKRM